MPGEEPFRHHRKERLGGGGGVVLPHHATDVRVDELVAKAHLAKPRVFGVVGTVLFEPVGVDVQRFQARAGGEPARRPQKSRRGREGGSLEGLDGEGRAAVAGRQARAREMVARGCRRHAHADAAQGVRRRDTTTCAPRDISEAPRRRRQIARPAGEPRTGRAKARAGRRGRDARTRGGGRGHGTTRLARAYVGAPGARCLLGNRGKHVPTRGVPPFSLSMGVHHWGRINFHTSLARSAFLLLEGGEDSRRGSRRGGGTPRRRPRCRPS